MSNIYINKGVKVYAVKLNVFFWVWFLSQRSRTKAQGEPFAHTEP